VKNRAGWYVIPLYTNFYSSQYVTIAQSEFKVLKRLYENFTRAANYQGRKGELVQINIQANALESALASLHNGLPSKITVKPGAILLPFRVNLSQPHVEVSTDPIIVYDALAIIRASYSSVDSASKINEDL